MSIRLAKMKPMDKIDSLVSSIASTEMKQGKVNIN